MYEIIPPNPQKTITPATSHPVPVVPLADFVRAVLTATGGNEHTARAYEYALGLFFGWLPGDLAPEEAAAIPAHWLPLATCGKLDLCETRRQRHYTRNLWEYRGTTQVLALVNAARLDNFYAWLKTQSEKASTADNRLRGVRTALSVGFRDGYITTEQAARMNIKAYRRRQKRTVQPTGRRLTFEEVKSLRFAVASSRTQARDLRDRAIIDLGLYAWLRRFEITALTPGSFYQEAGRWWMRIAHGKGDKERRIKVHDKLYASLVEWCKFAGLALGDGAQPLFTNLNKGGRSTGCQLNESVIGRIVGEYGHRAGLAPATGENALSPHDLRRTGARLAYEKGAPLPKIQAQLGHASIETTMIYIGVDDDPTNTAVDYITF